MGTVYILGAGFSKTCGVATDAEMLDELYLAALCRFPNGTEKSKLLEYVKSKDNRRAAWEDVAWGIANAKEFLLRR